MEGAMVSLPGRLEELVRRHGSKLPKGAEEEISLIKQDLEKIISVLHGHSEPKLEGQAMVVRCWMKEVARSTSPAQTQRHSGACCSGGEAAGCGYVEERATPVWRRRRCLWRLAVAVAVAAAAAAAVAAMTTTAAAAVARWKEARWWCVSVAAAAVAVIVVTGDMTASTASRGRGRRLHLAGAASF
ncbi:Os11g0685300, partial [Oryza sativa Japonica Group]